MRVKIRPHNLSKDRRDFLDDVSREYVDMKINEYMGKLTYKLARRVSLALCLALNDNYGFGAKRTEWIVGGIYEIINGVAADVYDKNELDPEARDKMVDNMMQELDDRNIFIVFNGDPAYDSDSVPDRKKRKKEREQAYKASRAR